MFCKSSKKVRDYLISTAKFDPEYCTSLLHGRMKPHAQELVDSIQGYTFKPEQIIHIQMLEGHNVYIDNSIAFLDSMLDKMIQPYEEYITLICSIPAIKIHAAIEIPSEIGKYMTLFKSSKHLCS